MKKAGLRVIIIILIILSVSLYLHWKLTSDSKTTSLIESAALTSLPTKDASNIDTTHVSSDLTPPTNKWFSGLALQKTPKTVFPTPLSFTPTENSFSVSLPKVSSTAATIFAGQFEPISIEITGATHYQVTRYDELSVDLTYSNAHSQLGTVTLTAGSPYIYFHALTTTTLTIKSNTSRVVAASSTIASSTTNNTKMTVAGFKGAKISQQNDQVSIFLPKDGLTTLYSLPPDSHNDPLLGSARNRITATRISYKKIDKNYLTTISLATDNHQATYYGLLPHQANAVTNVFGYDTLYGRQSLSKGTSISFSTPAISETDSLNLTKIDTRDKTLLVDTLRREINATRMTAEDTYFGGKELYRSAQLLQLAKKLGEDEIASSIQQKLREALTTWFSSNSDRSAKYFYYDTKIHGIVGETASFGSQEFNDHHFHYGYFIYAASILAKYDPDFLSQYVPMINLLVADIANYRANEAIPLRRSFDPYFGHSWASGSAPFNDGNNQESSSEAVNAWTAVGLWAQETKNTELGTEAGWMLSNEVSSTEHYWTNFDKKIAPYNQGYDHSIVSLNWGGKRDYATFFNANKSAMLGILLIPLNPTMAYQSSFGGRIDQQVEEAISKNDYAVPFGDYILMYSSLRHKADCLKLAKSLPDEIIDNANSRSYMYAWIMSQN